VPDAPGTELLAQELREALSDDVVLATEFFRDKGAIHVAPAAIGEVL
jgi:NADH-quinone oxidoreductase subunit C